MYKWILIGFAAQLVDGAIGMAYGVSARTLIRMFCGIDIITTSSILHCAEFVTTLVSAIAHYNQNNYNLALIKKLLVTGIVGGAFGTLFVVSYGAYLGLLIDIYLLVMGVVIIKKAFYKKYIRIVTNRNISFLGFLGGVLDASGGGWGPIVMSTLVLSQEDIKSTIGSVLIVEFFVTAVEMMFFATLVDNLEQYMHYIIGLIIGGIFAAPIATKICKAMPKRNLLIIIGCALIILNSSSIILSLCDYF